MSLVLILIAVQLRGVSNMKNKKFLLSIFLVTAISVSLLVMILVRTFLPIVIIPKFNVCNIMIVSLIAILINYYLTEEDFDFIAIPVAFLAFGILPYVSGFVTIIEALILALKGTVTFTVAMFIFSIAIERLSLNKKNYFAPIIIAFMLYLATQCLMGII